MDCLYAHERTVVGELVELGSNYPRSVHALYAHKLNNSQGAYLFIPRRTETDTGISCPLNVFRCSRKCEFRVRRARLFVEQYRFEGS